MGDGWRQIILPNHVLRVVSEAKVEHAMISTLLLYLAPLEVNPCLKVRDHDWHQACVMATSSLPNQIPCRVSDRPAPNGQWGAVSQATSCYQLQYLVVLCL